MWKRITVWVCAAVIALGTGVVLCAALLVKQSPSFRQAVLARMEQNIYETTGARVTVRDFALAFFPLHVDLYGVVMHGNEPQFGEPWLRAEHVGAGIEVRSLGGRSWRLRELVIDYPVVHVVVNQTGESNLPRPERDTGTKTSVFDLTVREVRLHGGEVDCNQQKILVDAELRNLHSAAGFDGSTKQYSGVLNYDQGAIKYGHYAPAVHSLALSFEAAPAKVTIKHLVVVAGKSRVELTASVEDYNNPAVQATYDAHLASDDLAPILRNASLPAGVVHAAGSLNYRRDHNRPALETLSLSGTLSDSAFAVTTPGLRVEASGLSAKYKLAGGNADLESINAQVIGGKVTGSLSVRDLGGAAIAKLQARLKDGSLEKLQSAERRDFAPEARLSGRISADVEASWSKAFEDLAARGNATLVGALGRSPAGNLRGTIHADYLAAGQQLAFHQTFIRTALTSIALEGNASEQSQLLVAIHSANLHEVELLAENLRLAPFGRPLENLDLYGRGSFTGSVSGPAGAPHLKGQLEASDLRVKETRWQLLRTDVDAGPSSLIFSNASLEARSATREKSQGPEPAAATAARSEGQISQSHSLATMK